MLIDRFGRRITNLRIAVTMRCNLNCIYCHREGQVGLEGEMSAEEISEIARVFYELGIKKVKITGGEPLLRKDICDIVSYMPEFEEISITTNGIFLEKLATKLKDSGLSRVNVSLDSLKPEVYKWITGSSAVNKVIRGVEAACEAELTPVKLNMVVMKDINHEEIEDMFEFIKSFNSDNRINVILQVIELLKMPGLEKYYYDISHIEKEFSEKASAVVMREMHFRRQYVLGNSVIEFVKPIDNKEFCMHCNRIRVTSDGKIKPCLMRKDNLVDIRGLKGNELINAIMKAVMLREPYFKKKH